MPLVWTKPNGSVRVMRFSPRYLTEQRQPSETISQVVMRLAPQEQQKTPDLADASPHLVLEAGLPANRTQRHKWRLQGQQCVIDLTVPDLPHPQQGLLDAIDSATTITALKAVLRQVVQ